MEGTVFTLYGIKVHDEKRFKDRLYHLDLTYNNRHEFVAKIALAYRKAAGRFSIYPNEFYKELEGYGVKTSKGLNYIPGSRGQFNMIRSAWLHLRGTEDDIVHFRGRGSASVVCLSNVIMDMYVNAQGKHAWEIKGCCKAFNHQEGECSL